MSEVEGLPDSRVGTQMAWLLEALAGRSLSASELEPRLSDSLLRSETASSLSEQILTATGSNWPFALKGYRETPTQAIVEVEDRMQVHRAIILRLDLSGLISGISVDILPDRVPATSVDEVERQIAKTQVTANVYAYDAGSQEVMIAVGADQPRPMASVFKIYVLAALTSEINSGRIGWETQVQPDASALRLPYNGSILEGEQYSMADAAYLMMAESDNIAADMIIDRVGAHAIERFAKELTGGANQSFSPFLTTKQYLELGWGKDRHPSKLWKDASEPKRLEILNALEDHQPTMTAASLKEHGPMWPAGIDWFGSAREVADVALWLHEQAHSSATLKGVLAGSIAPDLPPSQSTDWEVEHKGGRIQGVSTDVIVSSANGSTVVVVVLASSAVEDRQFARAAKNLKALEADLLTIALG